MGARKLKRSGPLEAEQEMGARKLNRKKGKQEVGQGVDPKKQLGMNLDASGFSNSDAMNRSQTPPSFVFINSVIVPGISNPAS